MENLSQLFDAYFNDLYAEVTNLTMMLSVFYGIHEINKVIICDCCVCFTLLRVILRLSMQVACIINQIRT